MKWGVWKTCTRAKAIVLVFEERMETPVAGGGREEEQEMRSRAVGACTGDALGPHGPRRTMPAPPPMVASGRPPYPEECRRASIHSLYLKDRKRETKKQRKKEKM